MHLFLVTWHELDVYGNRGLHGKFVLAEDEYRARLYVRDAAIVDNIYKTTATVIHPDVDNIDNEAGVLELEYAQDLLRAYNVIFKVSGDGKLYMGLSL